MSDLQPGDVLRGKYEILSEIGRGGMGVVYRARHILLDEFQALKLLLDARPQFIKSFLAEAQLVRRLRHPFIVEVFDVDVAENGFPFVVMEYVEGPSLRELLDRGPLPPGRALEIAARVCDALAFAHRRGVIHRDIKPQNILVSADPTPGSGGGHVKVIDFGIAKVLAEADMQVTGMLTAPTGFALGTPEYSSPEQAMGLPSHELDPRSDLYSVGLVLYEMLSGTRPFTAQTPMGVLIARLQQPPRPITDARPDLNASIVHLVMRSISADRADRYQSGEEMAAALRSLRASLIDESADLSGTLPETSPAPSAPAPFTAPTPAPPVSTPAPRGGVEQTPARPAPSLPPPPSSSISGPLPPWELQAQPSATQPPAQIPSASLAMPPSPSAAPGATGTTTPPARRPSRLEPEFLNTTVYTPPAPAGAPPSAPRPPVGGSPAAPSFPGGGAVPPAPPPPRRAALGVVLLLLLVVGIVVAAGWFLVPRFLGPAWQQARSLIARSPAPAPAQPQPAPAPSGPAEQKPSSAPAQPSAAVAPASQPGLPSTGPAHGKTAPSPPPPAPVAAPPRPPVPAVEQTPQPATAAPGSVRLHAQDGLNYVSIPPGEFFMGCSEGDPDCLDAEKPAHGVRITRGFWMGQTSVTVAAWKKFRSAAGKPALPGQDNFGRRLNEARGEDSFPATALTWDEAREFCQWSGGRLPTEAEWEYAARAGSAAARYGSLDEIAWFGDNSGNSPVDTTALWAADRQHYAQRLFANGNGPHPVGQKKPNAWKLYDTLGNVWNWVADWYADGSYQQGAAVDPPGPASGTLRVLRGGSWFFSARSIRVSNRLKYAPNLRVFDFGCRCARDQAP
jgi:serine/threonine-protein kinase